MHDLRVEGLALLQQQAHLVDQSGCQRGVVPVDGELVAPSMNRRALECVLNQPQVLVERADEAGHQMVGNGDSDGRGHRRSPGQAIRSPAGSAGTGRCYGRAAMPEWDDAQRGDELVAALDRWAAMQRAAAAAAGRARERSLRDQAATLATWTGVLVDLAEQGAPVTAVVANQRRSGRVIGVGRDFFGSTPGRAGSAWPARTQ